MTEVIEAIKRLEKECQPLYMEHYRHFHANPELSYQEKATAAYVAEKLRAYPLEEIKTGVGGHGVTALLRGHGKKGPVIGVRADMDALSFTEATGLSFSSRKKNVMHACGHDAHIAMQLGIVHVLSALKDILPGSVKFIFQPSEECTPRGGAPGMIEEGVLEKPRVDAIIGMHVWPMYATGRIGVQDGPVSAASDRLKIVVRGKSAHASMPHDGLDAIVAGAAVIGSLQSILSRRVDPRETAVITIGTVQGGTRYNVIADEVALDGTVRTFDSVVRDNIADWIERAAADTASAYGAKAEVDFARGYPSVCNNPRVAGLCRSAVEQAFGAEALLPPQKVPASGEDFAFYAAKIPAAFAWLGCRPPAVSENDQPPLHNARFYPDPDALPLGVIYGATAALRLMQEFVPGKK